MTTPRPTKRAKKPTADHPCDDHGFPIYEGDLIRSSHYTHYRNRRKCYLFHVVKMVDGVPWAMHYTVAAYPKRADGSCPLSTLMRHRPGSVEIVAGNNVKPFFERDRVLRSMDEGAG